VEHIGHSHFGPIDVSVFVAVTSLVVQGYFCYRIWVLNMWPSWFCGIVAIVCIYNTARVLWAPDFFLMQCVVTQSIGSMWAGLTVSTIPTFTESLVSQRLGIHDWDVSSA